MAEDLRHVRSDGALVLEPFASQDFRSDVHDTAYRCSGQNSAGAVLSRDVKVTAGEFTGNDDSLEIKAILEAIRDWSPGRFLPLGIGSFQL